MGLGVNFPKLSRNIELFFKEKICELSSRDGEPGGASVHGGGVQRRSPDHGSPALQSPGARRGLGKKERSSRGSSPRTSVADSTARGGRRR
jgi:hypothetical protein